MSRLKKIKDESIFVTGSLKTGEDGSFLLRLQQPDRSSCCALIWSESNLLKMPVIQPNRLGNIPLWKLPNDRVAIKNR